ncbi:response regulator [Devosia geojensis]|uniref:response regulator n=1 Tax=Devosia geojensis TaxID=443610 RepID=UPI0006964F6C|nr:response regulator transcription factor [Devosia geojensis]
MTEIRSAALSGSRVLVVEDDRALGEDLCRYLRENGATVLGPAPTAYYAYSLLLGRRGVDGAILDVRSHASAIFELARRLRELNVPMLFTTGSDPDIPPEFGSAPRILKPLSTGEVIEQVRRLVRRQDAGTARAPAASPLRVNPLSLDLRMGRLVARALRDRINA